MHFSSVYDEAELRSRSNRQVHVNPVPAFEPDGWSGYGMTEADWSERQLWPRPAPTNRLQPLGGHVAGPVRWASPRPPRDAATSRPAGSDSAPKSGSCGASIIDGDERRLVCLTCGPASKTPKEPPLPTETRRGRRVNSTLAPTLYLPPRGAQYRGSNFLVRRLSAGPAEDGRCDGGGEGVGHTGLMMPEAVMPAAG
ncbi:unnamed protein product [Protopolystoma xenopodis]|uniref:Uncharacterized protein n=1 Tax=Protopolystoma xenopodis TaxID=117903 RepID=A0A3S5CBV9_9PLAT|nr:unnamed protein product [Protopolystoma xenopodis]